MSVNKFQKHIQRIALFRNVQKTRDFVLKLFLRIYDEDEKRFPKLKIFLNLNFGKRG